MGACVGVRVCKRESVGARRERKSLRVAGFVVTSCVVTGDALIFFAFRIWVVHFLFDPRRGGVGVDPDLIGVRNFRGFFAAGENPSDTFRRKLHEIFLLLYSTASGIVLASKGSIMPSGVVFSGYFGFLLILPG